MQGMGWGDRQTDVHIDYFAVIRVTATTFGQYGLRRRKRRRRRFI